jgi:hypothetical protein
VRTAENIIITIIIASWDLLKISWYLDFHVQFNQFLDNSLNDYIIWSEHEFCTICRGVGCLCLLSVIYIVFIHSRNSTVSYVKVHLTTARARPLRIIVYETTTVTRNNVPSPVVKSVFAFFSTYCTLRRFAVIITMDTLVSLVCSHTGVDEPTAKKALGALLRFLKDQAAKTDFDFDDKILAKLDGSEIIMEDGSAKEVVAKTEAGGGVGGGGLMGSALSLIWSLLQIFGVLAMLKQLLQPIFGDYAVKLIDGIEEGAELASIFSALGIDRSQGITMMRTVIDFLKDKIDSDTIDTLVEQIPALKVVLSEEKKNE